MNFLLSKFEEEFNSWEVNFELSVFVMIVICENDE